MDKHIWNIHNATVYEIKPKTNLLDIYESIFVAPLYPQLKLFVNVVLEMIPLLDGLEQNVCFMTITDDTTFKIACDWCSLVNGCVETIKQNLIKHPDKRHLITNMQACDTYLDLILLRRTTKLTDTDAEHWCQTTFGYSDNDLLLFSRIYLKLEMIELRWCPFRRSRKLYYRNKDKRYLPVSKQTIFEVGRILETHETITCNNCPKIVNDNWQYAKCDTQSIFQPLLDSIISECLKHKYPNHNKHQDKRN
jgi:hypothetical protein